MTRKARRSKLTITRAEREELRAGLLGEEPELTFTPRGQPDPRLVALARLLGRQMARQDFAEQMENRETGSSR